MRLILGWLVPCARGMRDILLIGVPLALLAAMISTDAVRALLPVEELTTVLALASMAAAGMSAVLGAAIGRLTGDRRGTWMALGLALYSVAGVPATTLGASVDQGHAALVNVRIFAGLAMAATLIVSVCPSSAYHRWRCRSVFAVGLVTALLLGLIGALFPVESLAIAGHTWLRLTVVVTAAAAGLTVAATGWVTDSRHRSWVGLGFAVIALAHLDQAQTLPSSIPLGLTSSVVRLVGQLLVALGLSQLALHALVTVDQRQSKQQRELLLARRGLRKAAEQDHELRNGLAGLAGAAGVLVTRPDADLRAAMASELARLNALLHPSEQAPATGPVEYPVAPLLGELVALRRSTGMDLRLDADLGLLVRGAPNTLAQVVTNVLANCAAHAPGSPVRIQAGRRAESVFVRISDFGPGVDEGAERAVFMAGVRGPSSPGQGLGLHICQQLLKAEHGTIEIRSSRNGGAGCTVLIQLPAVEQADERDRSVARSPRTRRTSRRLLRSTAAAHGLVSVGVDDGVGDAGERLLLPGERGV
jgi:two-component system, OmpR family, sensor kinase